MTKKRSSSSTSSSFVRPLFSLGSKLVISLSALLCILAFLRLHSQQTISNSPTLHTFNDHFEGSPKVTFLFLTRQNLPLDFVWHSFFKASENSGIVDLCHFAFYAFAGRTGRLQWSRKNEVFHKQLPAEAVELVSRLLQYSPNLHCTTVIRKE